MRRRFFVERFDGARAALRGESVEHLGRVLRAEPGQLYELSDGQALWLARVEDVKRDAVEFALVEQLPVKEPTLRARLLLSIVKFDRFEWCLEKATELGAEEVIPLAAARSEKPLIAAAAKRARRWEKILIEAAQQSRRLSPPRILPPLHPAEAFPQSQAQLKILLSESREAPRLRTVLERSPANLISLALGPEGGWIGGEVEAARRAGFVEASLGGNILRTETAVIAALAILNYVLGD